MKMKYFLVVSALVVGAVSAEASEFDWDAMETTTTKTVTKTLVHHTGDAAAYRQKPSAARSGVHHGGVRTSGHEPSKEDKARQALIRQQQAIAAEDKREKDALKHMAAMNRSTLSAAGDTMRRTTGALESSAHTLALAREDHAKKEAAHRTEMAHLDAEIARKKASIAQHDAFTEQHEAEVNASLAAHDEFDRKVIAQMRALGIDCDE